MNSLIIGLLGLAAFMLLLVLRMPIAYAMALVGFAGFSLLTSVSSGFSMVAKEIYNTFSSYSLGVIVMFIWMGFLAYYSGIGSRLYVFAYQLIGHWPEVWPLPPR